MTGRVSAMISGWSARAVDLGSGWAQQGSNLRPLGEQHSMYQGCNSPTDLAGRPCGMYQNVRGCTPFSAVKVPGDLRRRMVDVALLAVLFPPLYVLAVLMDRQDRKAGQR